MNKQNTCEKIRIFYIKLMSGGIQKYSVLLGLVFAVMLMIILLLSRGLKHMGESAFIKDIFLLSGVLAIFFGFMASIIGEYLFDKSIRQMYFDKESLANAILNCDKSKIPAKTWAIHVFVTFSCLALFFAWMGLGVAPFLLATIVIK